MPESPRWTAGEPANLPAAAQDARTWLCWFARREALTTRLRLDRKGRARLVRCLACLERELTQPVARVVRVRGRRKIGAAILPKPLDTEPQVC